MGFHLNVPHSWTNIYLFVYNKNQMYIPNSVSAFGSAEKLIAMRSGIIKFKLKLHSVFLNIKKTHKRRVDSPSERCSNDLNGQHMTACLAEYIQSRIGCNTNIQGIMNTERAPCNSTQQFRDYINVSQKLQHADASTVHKMTGCMPSCEFDKFDIELTDRAAVTYPHNSYYGKNYLGISISMRDSAFWEEEEYLIYDFDSFIADVGGYMGLLLGSSFLSLFDEIESYLRALYRASSKKSGLKV